MKYAPIQQHTSDTDYSSPFSYSSGKSNVESENWKFAKNKGDEFVVVTEETEIPDQQISIKLLNWVMQIMAFFLCLVTLPFSLFFIMKMVPQYERILVYRLGRLYGVKGPGLVFVLPCLDKWSRIDLRTKAFHIPPTSLSTKDGGVISVGALVYFRIVDPVKTSLTVTDVNKAVRHVSQSCMSSLLSKKTFDVVITKRLNLSYDLQVDINLAAQDWGAEVSGVELSDINLLVKPKQMQNCGMFGGSMAGGTGDNQLMSGLASLAQHVIAQAQQGSSTNAPEETSDISQLINNIKLVIDADLVGKVGLTYAFEIDGCTYALDLKNHPGSVGAIPTGANFDADVRISLSANTLSNIMNKKLSMLSAYSSGKLKLNGSVSDAAKLSHLSDLLETASSA